MAAFYGDILPNDLILQLALYLNYRDVWLLRYFGKVYENICFSPELWIYKIRNELGYDNKFIQEYVYDSTKGEKKTLLPINEKYMELKSRNSVDFGSENYVYLHILLYRASRLKDYNMARELVNYLMNLNLSYIIPKDSRIDAILGGATSVGNIQLIHDTITNYLHVEHINDLSYQDKILVMNAIVKGYYEAPKSVRAKINLQDYDINDIVLRGISNFFIMAGLAAGNHLEELKTYNPDLTSLSLLMLLGESANEGAAYDVINYYKFNKSNNLDTLITYNGVTDKINISEVPFDILLESGYLEYSSLVKTPNFVPLITIIRTLIHNHLDTINHYVKLFRKDKDHLVSSLSDALPDTYEYFRLNILDVKPSDIYKKVVNIDLKEYLTNK